MKKSENLNRTDSLWICSGNTFRIMKLSSFLFLVTILNAFGSRSYSQNARLSLEMKDVPILSVLNAIEDQSEFFFLYSSKMIDVNQKVDIAASDEKITDVLDDLFTHSDIKYSVMDRQILLVNSKTEKTFELQQKKITGTVTDQKGNPLPGVNVVVKGTFTGAISDVDGKYTIETENQNPTLVFSFVGFVQQTVATDGKTSVDVAMAEDIARLDEVVVIGYGTVKKRDLTGAVSSIQTQDLGNSSVANVGQLMQGKVAGLDITSGEGGKPGAGMEIKIRGTTSLNSTAPLTIIDGMVGDVDMVSPSEIESVDVLKDASAAAIYGSRGANGVIIITTKKGKTGAPSFNYEGYFGVSTPGNKLDILNASDYIDLVYDIQGGTYDQATGHWLKPAGMPSVFDNDASVRTDRVNMQDELFRNAGIQSHSFDMSGGSQSTKYRLSAGYFDQGSTRGNFDYQRFNFKSNIETKIGKHVLIGNNTMFRQIRTKGQEGDIGGAIRWAPYVGVFSDESDNPGHYSYITNEDNLNDAVNPMTFLAYDFNNYMESKLLTQLYAEITIIEGLKFHSQFQYEYASSNTLNYREKDYMNSIQQTNFLEESYTTGSWPKFENYLTYSKAIGLHSFSLLGGINYENNLKGRGVTVKGTGYGGQSIPVLKPTVGSDPATVPNSNVWENASLSYFGRASYSFMDKYLLTFNFRADASYKFAPSNRWGYFPSIALAWKLKEEAFLRDVEWISSLKARISWGKAGNDAIREYLYNANVYTGGYSGGDNIIVYPFGPDFNLTSTGYGSTVNALPSPSIRWEETTTKGLGMDGTFFKDKLSLTVDYYDKFTDGILIEVPVPLSTGLTQPQVKNAASVINRGVDLQIGYVGNTAVGFNYNITAVAGYNKNWVKSLGDGQPIFGVNTTEVGYLTRTAEGFPIGYFYGYKTDGINYTAAEAAEYNEKFGTTTEAGDYRFKDLNGDGKISDADRTNLGNGMPKWTYGLNASMEFKNFDLRVVFSGAYGYQLVDWNGTYWFEGGVRPFNGAATLLNRWRYDGDTQATLPRAEKTDPSKNTRFSDRYVKDGSYGRLKNLTIGYTIRAPFLNKAVNNLRIYVSMENLLTVTKYTGFDPEVGVKTNGTDNGTTGRGVDFTGIPLPKNYLFGVQLSF
jgi:TonB-dependent starch-binding outer membrane protein SusC